MPLPTPEKIFVQLLSTLRNGTVFSTTIYQEISQVAEEQNIRDALEARAFISDKALETLDQCFNLIGEKPVKVNSRFHEIFVEDFRRELAEIENPAMRHLFILARAIQLTNLRIAEYVVLLAAADASGHHGVGVLLESCLADNLAFVDRTRRTIRHLVEAKELREVIERIAA
jgi:ferritin-like metal-binding protein YciE